LFLDRRKHQTTWKERTENVYPNWLFNVNPGDDAMLEDPENDGIGLRELTLVCAEEEEDEFSSSEFNLTKYFHYQLDSKRIKLFFEELLQ
jgi:hypothetical protein